MKTRLGVLACLIALGAAANADAAPREKRLDSVIAVVGDHPILLSELRHRMTPHRLRVRQLPEAQRKGAEAQLMKDLFARLITERLIDADAARSSMTVSADDIDQAITLVASNVGTTPAEVLRLAKEQGLEEIDYRDELRRQILEAKWDLRHVQPRAKGPITPQVARQQVLGELTAEFGVEVMP